MFNAVSLCEFGRRANTCKVSEEGYCEGLQCTHLQILERITIRCFWKWSELGFRVGVGVVVRSGLAVESLGLEFGVWFLVELEIQLTVKRFREDLIWWCDCNFRFVAAA